MQKVRRSRPRLNLALQGGGAHGAFTWGALDRLLEEEDFEIGRISGTSAGALNGAALATGLETGGREGARMSLAKLWQRIAEAGSLLSLLHVPLKKPGLGVWDDAMPLLSPYQTNPLSMEPLRYALSAVVDVDVLRRAEKHPLYVNAVNVQTGHSRVFEPAEMSIDVVLASGCAPLLFQAVQIDGESYWDGSYGANPMLWPLYHDEPDGDILMVELTPQRREETPATAKNILNRINEIASINGMLSEIRALVQVNQARGSKATRLHVLSLPESDEDGQVEPSTKRTIDMMLFESLRRRGYGACSEWLASHRDAIGNRASVDAHQRYLLPYRQGRSTALQ
jgi:NTE family protein